MIRTLAPSGSPIQIDELVACLGSGDAAMARLDVAVRARLGVKHAFFFANGRGAMTLLLRELARKKNQPSKNVVILPSYT